VDKNAKGKKTVPAKKGEGVDTTEGGKAKGKTKASAKKK
jgi:hypothetical protein